MIYKFSKNQIDSILNEEIQNRKESLQKMVGELENTRVEYPKATDIDDDSYLDDKKDNKPKEAPMLKMPEELVSDTKNLVDILGNAKTVLTKLGNHTSGPESEELWSYHRKVEKIIIDIQRKFKITH